MPDIITPAVALPVRLASRPRDKRGFVVPYFVAWLTPSGGLAREPDGAPDFRVIDTIRFRKCVNHKRCWVCGQPLGVHMVFVLGPMCTINRVISEPPSHKECAEYAAKVCPFMLRPRMRRNEKGLPENRIEPAGMANERNPGIYALWTTRSYQVVKAHAGNEGVLIRIGPPESVTWWREGRHATRAEGEAALEEGFNLLLETAKKEGNGAVADLERLTQEAWRTLPVND